jgi:hypothetical protein
MARIGAKWMPVLPEDHARNSIAFSSEVDRYSRRKQAKTNEQSLGSD